MIFYLERDASSIRTPLDGLNIRILIIDHRFGIPLGIGFKNPGARIGIDERLIVFALGG